VEVCKSLGLPPGEEIKFVTLVANLRHMVKNVPMFLRAAKRVIAAIPDAHFVIAGEGELESELRSLAEETGIASQTHFIGRCNDIPALLSISTACGLTSTAEGFSNSILEYMAAGRPVVATKVGGAAEAVIDGETGYLVASDDDKSMAAYLIELLQNDKKSTEMGSEGREIIEEKFSAVFQISQTLELYQDRLSRAETRQ
jgi:glycosyltransferase involved in cell wall biosynthesis